jgi:hypothetical protein
MQIDDNKIVLFPNVAAARRVEHFFNIFSLAPQLVDSRGDVLVRGSMSCRFGVGGPFGAV